MDLKVWLGPNKAGTTFKTASAAAVGRVKTIHRRLQVSSIVVHMYLALQLPQVKVYQWNSEGEKFAENQVTTKIMNYNIPQKFVHIQKYNTLKAYKMYILAS